MTSNRKTVIGCCRLRLGKKPGPISVSSTVTLIFWTLLTPTRGLILPPTPLDVIESHRIPPELYLFPFHCSSRLNPRRGYQVLSVSMNSFDMVDLPIPRPASSLINSIAKYSITLKRILINFD